MCRTEQMSDDKCEEIDRRRKSHKENVVKWAHCLKRKESILLKFSVDPISQKGLQVTLEYILERTLDFKLASNGHLGLLKNMNMEKNHNKFLKNSYFT